MNKREFLKKSAYAAGGLGLLGSSGLFAACSQKSPKSGVVQGKYSAPLSVSKVNRREKVLAVLDRSKPNVYVPAAFFMHFNDKFGQGAVKSHIDFFRATNMDFSKIQYEVVLPHQPEIKSPKDWDKIKIYGKELNLNPNLTQNWGYEGEVGEYPYKNYEPGYTD